jgi:hypothetical protein
MLALAVLTTTHTTKAFAAETIGSQPTDLIDSSVIDIKSELGKTLGCKWFGEGPVFQCSADPLGASLVVTASAKGSLESIEIGALNVTHPKDIKAEQKSKAYVYRLMAQLFPTWKGSAEWLKKALQEARSGDEDKAYETTVAGWNVSVTALQPADLDDLFATIVVSKAEQTH